MPAESEILIGEISDDAIKKLVASFGGRRIYVPQSIDPDHPITKTIGAVEAKRLSKINGGVMIFIPKKHKVTMRMRNLQILQALIQGESVETVSKRHGMTERNVRIIASKMVAGNFCALRQRVQQAKMVDKNQMELNL